MTFSRRLDRLEAALQRASRAAVDYRGVLRARLARIREVHEAAEMPTAAADLSAYSLGERYALGDPSFGPAELMAHVQGRASEKGHSSNLYGQERTTE